MSFNPVFDRKNHSRPGMQSSHFLRESDSGLKLGLHVPVNVQQFSAITAFKHYEHLILVISGSRQVRKTAVSSSHSQNY